MRYLRELLELIFALAIGLAVAWFVHEHYPRVIPHGMSHETWFCLNGGIGLLLATMWSGWKVGRTVDRRLPRHLRPMPRFRDGRPFGVLAWRARDLALEYLWLVLGVLVVLVVIWLAKTFEPGWFR
jgi:hypothetical protein